MGNVCISIVVPVYRAEAYLRRCLESVRAQTFTDWELILIDDGSPDRCGQICDAYAAEDARIHAIHQENQGQSAARNVGMKACCGTYLCFLDADDYLAEDALAFLKAQIEKGGFDIVMAGHRRVEPDGSTPLQSGDWNATEDRQTILRDILCNRLPNFVWGKLYKRSLWEGISFPNGQTMEDLYILPSVFQRAKRICVTPRPVYFYSHENGESTMNGRGIQDYIRLRYGKFLAWREHESAAAQIAPDCANDCAAQAIHGAVRAWMLDAGMGTLSTGEKQEILFYLQGRRDVPVRAGTAVGRWLILSGRTFLLRCLGGMQRRLAVHQQKRRQRRSS